MLRKLDKIKVETNITMGKTKSIKVNANNKAKITNKIETIVFNFLLDSQCSPLSFSSSFIFKNISVLNNTIIEILYVIFVLYVF